MAVWYVRDNAPTATVGWSAVTAWAANTVTAAGLLRRQLATPTVGNERVFISIVAGTTHATTEPTWTVTKGAKTTDGTVTWQECTGQPAVNGNVADTPASSTVRSIAQSLGKIIKNNAGTHLFILSTAGTPAAGEPTYNTAAVGNTTADGTATWTYIGTSFSVWAAPHARLANAFATNWGAAGDTFYLRSDHAETQAAAMTLTPPGTIASPVAVYSVDGSGAIVAGASISTTGNNAMSLAGASAGASIDGVIFNCGSGAVAAILTVASAGGSWYRLKDCSLRKNGTSGTTSAITLGANSAQGNLIELINTTLHFGATGDGLRVLSSRVAWLNTPSAIGGTVPTNLFTAVSKSGGNILLEGVDLSALGSGKKIVALSSSDAAAFNLVDCQIGASVTVSDTPTSPIGSTVDLIRSDSAGSSYRQERYWYQGTLTAETAIVRTGGASDGTTPLAWKIVTTANSKWILPFESFQIAIWNDAVGAPITLTIYGTWGGGAVPNNDDIWIEVEYLGSSASPIASVSTSTKANNLAAGSALSSDGSTWGGGTTAFAMSVTFTPEIAGYVRTRVKAARASSTFYVDPQPELS